MLQQTQVATVIDYFKRFLARFPNVAALASASEEEVMSMWAGLGYYRRARQLHAAAQKIVSEHAGKFPRQLEQILELPGVGRYTAGAVASIALGQPAPIVEANTERLYARLLKLEKPVRDPEATRLLWQFAQWQLDGLSSLKKSSKKRDAGMVNQAVMELGALVCKPVDPQCLVCPLVALCPTAKSGLQHRIPPPKPKREFTALHHIALVVQHRGRWLLRLNPPGGWWHGLWDFPRIDATELQLRGNSTSGTRARRELQLHDSLRSRIVQLAHQQLLAGQSSDIIKSVHEPVLSLSHGVTRYKIVVDGLSAEVDQQYFAKDKQWKWVDAQAAADMPLTATAKKMFSQLAAR